MLHPDDRCLLSEQVLPPTGIRSRSAHLHLLADLTALGGVPLALLQSDPLALGDAAGARLEALRAVREMAARLTVFCQAGAIHVPAEWRDAFLWLEASVVQVRPVATRAVFHPKLWLLRFENQDGAVRYRLLVLSRNLTYDRSWDVIAQLEGPVIDRQNAIRENAPLVQFVKALGDEAAVPAVGGMADAHRERRDRFARELRTVRFDAQDKQIEDWAFWPLGIPGHQYRSRNCSTAAAAPFRPGRRARSAKDGACWWCRPSVRWHGGHTRGPGFPVSLVSRDDALDEMNERLPEHWFPRRGHAFTASGRN
jgi:hypothetical protein